MDINVDFKENFKINMRSINEENKEHIERTIIAKDWDF